MQMVKDMGFTMHHLIALTLFIGDYRFEPLQEQLMDCLKSQNPGNQMRSFYHWRTLLEEALLLLIAIRRSLGISGVMVLNRDMDLEETLWHLLDCHTH